MSNTVIWSVNARIEVEIDSLYDYVRLMATIIINPLLSSRSNSRSWHSHLNSTVTVHWRWRLTRGMLANAINGQRWPCWVPDGILKEHTGKLNVVYSFRCRRLVILFNFMLKLSCKEIFYFCNTCVVSSYLNWIIIFSGYLWILNPSSITYLINYWILT